VLGFPTRRTEADPAYLPPELSDVLDYDFDTSSDMYSFGVLLYQLLTDELPFANPEEARAAGGCPSKMPSDVRAGVDSKIDELALDLLRTDDFKLRPSATEALSRIRQVLGMTTGPGRKDQSDPPHPCPRNWRLVPSWTESGGSTKRIGKGTFARVYRVFNLDHQRTYAMKVLVDTDNADLALHEFNEVQPLLPTHPNVVRIVWMDRLAPPLGHPYIVSEFVDGETLTPYCADERRLAWSDIKRIGLELLDALQAIHERGVYHRDIKPPNIMLELPAHRPKLIDFNIAAKATEAKGRAGTRRYWAPDVTTAGWGAHADLFSLGVVLYELVVHRHPFPQDRPENGSPYDPRDVAVEQRLSREIAEFLTHAVQPQAVKRFQSAAEMKAALNAVPSMLAPAAPEPPPSSFRGLTLDEEERERNDIAFNEGRLLDFLAHGPRAGTYSGLRRFVVDSLAGASAPDGALLVNLNLRAVTAGGSDSLVERQLMQLLQPELWAACGACSLRELCPLLHNANTLRDANSGPAVRERVRRLFEVVHLRRRAHVTMRDLRSALSWLLLRDHGCGDVAALVEHAGKAGVAPLLALNYTEAFADADAGAALPVQTVGPERVGANKARKLFHAAMGRFDDRSSVRNDVESRSSARSERGMVALVEAPGEEESLNTLRTSLAIITSARGSYADTSRDTRGPSGVRETSPDRGVPGQDTTSSPKGAELAAKPPAREVAEELALEKSGDELSDAVAPSRDEGVFAEGG
jgi:serine/threonine protein kinase